MANENIKKVKAADLELKERVVSCFYFLDIFVSHSFDV